MFEDYVKDEEFFYSFYEIKGSICQTTYIHEVKISKFIKSRR